MDYLLNDTGGRLTADVGTDFLTDEIVVADITGTLGVTEASDVATFAGVVILLSQAVLGDHVLDNGLIVLSTEANALWLSSADPTADYAVANGLRLASKSGAPFGAPSPTANGSAVASIAITTGSGLAGGTCTHWAAVDSANSRVLARGPLDIPGSIAIGQTFSLPSFTIELLAHG